MEKEILKSHRSIGDKLGYDVSIERECYAWEYRKDNRLEKTVCD